MAQGVIGPWRTNRTDKFDRRPDKTPRQDSLGLFTPCSFLPVHLHWTTTSKKWGNVARNPSVEILVHVMDILLSIVCIFL